MMGFLVQRNIFLLAVSQALVLSSTTMSMAVGAIVGKALAPSAALATVPVALMLVGTALFSVPAGRLMQRHGRRVGFMTGAAIGLVGSLAAALAIQEKSLLVFSLGLFLVGTYQSFGNFYRFAAADAADATNASRAISLVVSGGLFAAFLGPQLAEWGRNIVSGKSYLGAYLLQAGLAGAAVLILGFLTIPRRSGKTAGRRTLPVSRILERPGLYVAIIAGAVSYALMSALMITTPLAMLGDGHAQSSATPVIQWHVVGMFAPSFITGTLIRRWGAPTVILAGFSLIAVNIFIAMSGTSFWAYLTALALLGVGWNFAFIGSTALLTQSARPNQLARVQSLNELFVFGLTALAGLSAGWIFTKLGWNGLNLVALPIVVLALLIVSVYTLSRRGKLARLQAAS